MLKLDGIWLVPPAPENPRLVFAANNLIAIIGAFPQQASNLLVVARTNDTKCHYALRMANVSSAEPLETRRLQTPAGSPPECFNGVNDLRDMIKASRRRNDVIVFDTRRHGANLGLSQLTRTLMVNDDPQPEPLTPKINAREDSIGRFSPNWWSDNEVIYVAFP